MRVVELRWEKHLFVSIFLVFLTFLANSSSEEGFYEYPLTCGTRKRRATGKEDKDLLEQEDSFLF